MLNVQLKEGKGDYERETKGVRENEREREGEREICTNKKEERQKS